MHTQHQQSCPAPVASLNPAASATVVSAAPIGRSRARDIALKDLPQGSNATIRDIRAQGILGRRLRDMGLLPGVAVSLMSRAPLGDPLVVALDGYTLSVRCTEAACVIVEMDQ